MSGFQLAVYGGWLAVLGACFGVGCALHNGHLALAAAVVIAIALYLGATK